MFVDASAMVAILTGEPERRSLLLRLDDAVSPTTSIIAVFETVAAVARKKAQTVETTQAQVGEFLTTVGIAVVPIAEGEGREALVAFSRYGKGRGHPAQLNMGDCFAYACAKTRGVPLLFVGNDFSQTDIPSVLP